MPTVIFNVGDIKMDIKAKPRGLSGF